MHQGIGAADGHRAIEWGRAAEDYERYRPSYPIGLYTRLAALGVGLPGQRVLDLGTGTGFLARQLARQGCRVTAVDVSAGQVERARAAAESEGLRIDFRVAPAEATLAPNGAFDVVTAGQCFLYFDLDRLLPELRRVLVPGGRLVTCHLAWLPRQDPIAAATEALILRHNPDWSASNWDGVVPPKPAWSDGRAVVEAMFWFDHPISFTHERWRGRIRASRGIGAELAPAEVDAFDRALALLLAAGTPDPFEVLHRVDAHVFTGLTPA